MKRKISFHDAAIIGTIIFLVLIAVWLLTKQENYDLPPMIMVDGQIYQYQQGSMSVTDEPDGQIKMIIESSEVPHENDMANFGEEGMDLLEAIRAYGNDDEQMQTVCIMYEMTAFDEVLQETDYIFKAVCTANSIETYNKIDSFFVEEILEGEVENDFIEARRVAYDNYKLGETYVLFADRISNEDEEYYIPSWEVQLNAEGAIISYSESIEDFPEQVTNYDELVEYIKTKQEP